MTLTVRPRRRFSRISALVALVAVLLGAMATPGHAEPTKPPNEGVTPKLSTLRSNLEASAIGYLDAEAALHAAQKKQTVLAKELVLAELDLARLRIGVGKYASQAYRTGRLSVLGMMLNTTSSDGFLTRAAAIEQMAQRDQSRLHALTTAQRRAKDAKDGIDAAVREQTKQAAEMKKRRKAAERALSAVGGYAVTGWVDPFSVLARPAPRNSDGSWPREICSINDPTTNGCITPRTLHAMQEAKKAAFNWYVSCYRPGDMYEHPKGRACDFSSERDGFHNFSSKGDSKLYGDRLASFYVKNASRLGVLYVIWYCKVWIPGSGWRKYSATGSNCGDSPAGDHTNHVHLSVY